MPELTYEEKLIIANKYCNGQCGFDWNELPDINSLHDYDTEEDIRNACEDRINNIIG